MKRVVFAIIAISINIQIISQDIVVEPPVTMLALGDSYTIGESVQPEERWPHQLAAQLNALGIAAELPDYIAVTGWTTQNLLQGIRSSLNSEKNYNLVSILIGVNNQYQGLDIETYEPDLREIIELALKVVSDDTGKIFMLSIPDYAYTPFGNGNESITEQINAYNQINYRVATAYNLTYVNITTISRRGLAEPTLVAGDGLHPSGLQYALWVEAVISFIARDHTMGIEGDRIESNRSSKVRLIPNPAKDIIQIQWQHIPKSIRIMDVSGKILTEERPSGYSLQMDLGNYEPGIYWVESTFATDRSIVPFMIN